MKILVIEDNPISRKMVRVALESEGYSVIEAADGKSGLAAMAEQMPDLVLQDLLLPDVNGFDLVGQLRALPGAANIAIIALTGLIAKADEMRVAAAPFTDYLFKPVEPSLLVSTIRTHLVSVQNYAEKAGKNRRVLVIDDEPLQLKVLETYLVHLGFDVTTAADGTEGLSQAKRWLPDAILSDVLMPGMDGFQLCLSVRKDLKLCRVPVVLLSNSYDNETDKQLARNMGAYALVARTPDFREAIEALLQSLRETPPVPVKDMKSLEAEHRERMAQQLHRQTKLSGELARRCATQSVQISVLASMGENFLHGRVETQDLVEDVLGHYLNAMGFSCGAIYLVDSERQLTLSAQIGFPNLVAKSLPNFFGYEGVLQDAMRTGEPVSVSISPGRESPFARLLSHLRAETLLISPLRFGSEQLGVIALISDTPRLDADWLTFSKAITNQIGQVIALSRAISSLQHLALYDTLTDLPNRAQLRERLQQAIAEGQRAALYLLNLHRFQEINNTLSYRNGNILLRQVAKRLKETFSDRAIVARLGADEFSVLLTEVSAPETVHRVAHEITESLEPTFRLDGLPIAVSATIGIALVPDGGEDADTLLSYADMAQRAAKKTGNDYLIYPAHVEPYSPDHLPLLGELREAIDHDKLTLYYQPKVSFKTGQTIGVEALLRWDHPNRGWIPPDQFIPLAERAGLIHTLTLWVVRAALRQARHWRDAGLDIGVAVNVSARDLQDESFPDYIGEVCRTTGTHHKGLTLELTERDLMADPAKAEMAIERLSATGVQLSIDDFGTGYSGLSYLHKLPVNEIKIDKSFVAGLLGESRSAAIVRSIIDLGRNLGLTVVAEGVEDQQTLQRLAELGCDAAQGYHICRPIPPAELTRWFKESPWGTARNGAGREQDGYKQ